MEHKMPMLLRGETATGKPDPIKGAPIKPFTCQPESQMIIPPRLAYHSIWHDIRTRIITCSTFKGETYNESALV